MRTTRALPAGGARLLFDQAVLAEGGELHDPASFVRHADELLISIAR